MGIKSFLVQQLIKAIDMNDESIWTNIFPGYTGTDASRSSYKSQIEQFQGIVYTCASINAKSVMSTPYKLYTTKPAKNQNTKSLTELQRKQLSRNQYVVRKGIDVSEVQEVKEHPFLDLLWYFNAEQTSSSLIEGTVIFLETTGNNFWRILMNEANTPAEIRILPTQTFNKIKRDDKGNITAYNFANGTIEGKDYSVDEIVHYKYFNPFNQEVGLSRVAAASVGINRLNKMDFYESIVFENPTPSIYMKVKKKFRNEDEAQKAADEWKQKYGGVKNTGKLPILDDDKEILPIGFTPREMGFLTGRKLTIMDIANCFGIPIGMIDREAHSQASRDTDVRQHAMMAVLPICNTIQEIWNEKILAKIFNSKNLYVLFDNPVSEDRELILNENKTALAGMPWKTINEVRYEEGLDEIDGGDTLYAPNGTPVGTLPQNAQMAYGKMIEDVLKQVKVKIEGGG